MDSLGTVPQGSWLYPSCILHVSLPAEWCSPPVSSSEAVISKSSLENLPRFISKLFEFPVDQVSVHSKFTQVKLSNPYLPQAHSEEPGRALLPGRVTQRLRQFVTNKQVSIIKGL